MSVYLAPLLTVTGYVHVFFLFCFFGYSNQALNFFELLLALDSTSRVVPWEDRKSRAPSADGALL